ncbi:polysaccharide biosynthesis C-terminal domain-containing protein [Chlorobium phaeovibrioides]|uniref:polysaccharide biosynthesis C-terminal domain-containing protein n=1 Tax=Chlorobium phaeovibrioides TaxID=1094 RepID=UPI0021D526C4|nr:polysaccharide biosynthesis C-terminal domain-containing protein [Chlorobium phaeovibrioides]
MAATLLAMTGHARLSLMNAAAALLLQLLLNLILIPRMGIEGAALGSLLLFLTLSVARLLEVRSLLGLHPFSKALFKPLAAGAGSALGFFFLPPVFYTLPGALLPAAALCVLGLSYAVILLLLGLEEDEREIILQFRSLLGRKG